VRRPCSGMAALLRRISCRNYYYYYYYYYYVPNLLGLQTECEDWIKMSQLVLSELTEAQQNHAGHSAGQSTVEVGHSFITSLRFVG